ncbi:MAG: hypothetical protein R3F20_14790 [Planctomycetota bacterium]
MTPRTDRRPRGLTLATLLLLGACSGGVVKPSLAVRGNEHLDEGRPYQAVESYRQALVEKPGDYRLTYNLGLAWHDAYLMARDGGDAAAATDALNRARETYALVYETLDPGNVRARASRAVLERDAGELDEARRMLREFAADAGAESFLANYTLGILDRDAGDAEGAEAAFRRALAANPTHVPTTVALVDLLEARKAPAEEISEALTAAGEANAFDFTLKKREARLALRRAGESNSDDDWRAAFASLKRAQQLTDDDWEICEGLAICHARVGELRDAVHHLWRAQALLGAERDARREEERTARLAAMQQRLTELYRRLEAEDAP